MARQKTEVMEQLLGADRKKDAAPQEAQGQEDPLKAISLKMPESWIGVLKAHFKAKGLGLSLGVRMALSEYMDREVLRL